MRPPSARSTCPPTAPWRKIYSNHSSRQPHLQEASQLADNLRSSLMNYPDLFYAGYTQDALKEFVEANVTCALIRNEALPTPEELGVADAPYLHGLADA